MYLSMKVPPLPLPLGCLASVNSVSTCLGVFKHKVIWVKKIEAYYVDSDLEKCL